MKKVSALTVRQSLGRVLDQLEKTGEPVIVEKDRRPRAVLITLADFERRFVDVTALERRRQIAAEIRAMRDDTARSATTAVESVRELRGPLP
jgi:PHD/YefM family antitoxin component YafN of YafNO toxin-antitoxin module